MATTRMRTKMTSENRKPEPGDVWWADCLHLDDAKEIGGACRCNRRDPCCKYTVPGKERPVIILHPLPHSRFLACKLTSALDGAGRSKEGKLTRREFNRRYVQVSVLLDKRKESLLEKPPENIPANLLRRPHEKKKLDRLEFDPILKALSSLKLFGKDVSDR